MKNFALSGILVCVVLSGWQVVIGSEKQLGSYSYWAWASGDYLGEAVKINLLSEAQDDKTKDESVTQWLVLTPGGNRASVTQIFTPTKGRILTRFEDEETGWWAEEFFETDPADLVEVPAGTYSDFSMSVRFETADGFHLAKNLGPNDPAADQWFDEWVQEAVELKGGGPIDRLPASVVEELLFLASLGLEDEGFGIAESSIPLVDAGSSDVQAPEYGGEWNEGEVTGTSSPAVEVLLDRFKSERTKRAVSWAKDQLAER